jgi:hypothetical protein
MPLACAEHPWSSREAATLPTTPTAELSAEEVLSAVFRGLQFNNEPLEDTGLRRCFAFMDSSCKHLVTWPAFADGRERSLERFVAAAAKSNKIKPFVGARSVRFGELTRIAGTPTRGEIVTVAVHVRSSLDPLRFATSGLPQADGPIVPATADLPKYYDDGIGAFGTVAVSRADKKFAVRLMRQRRPPLACVAGSRSLDLWVALLLSAVCWLTRC